MENELIQKAQELRKHGFTTGEIADELNVSMDTARWLTLQKPRDEKPEAPVDFAINWRDYKRYRSTNLEFGIRCWSTI